MNVVRVKLSLRSLEELNKKKCCLVVYRVIDKGMRQQDLVSSPIPLASGVIRDVVRMVYGNPKEGLAVLKTDPQPYLDSKSALITDIVVIAPCSQRREALDIFNRAKKQSNLFKRERLTYVEKQVKPLIKDLFKRKLILAAALRGNSFEKGRFATPFDDLDILLFLQKKKSMQEIAKKVRAVPGAKNIRILHPTIVFENDTLSGFACRCFTVERNSNGHFDIEFDLVYLEECFKLLQKKADLPSVRDFVEFGSYTLVSCIPIIGNHYIARKKKELWKFVAEKSCGKLRGDGSFSFGVL